MFRRLVAENAGMPWKRAGCGAGCFGSGGVVFVWIPVGPVYMKNRSSRRGLASGTFSLAMLFWVLTLVGLFLSLFQLSPLSAVFATLVLAPTLIRTVICVQAWDGLGMLRESQRAKIFLTSLAIVCGMLLVALVTALAVCLLFGLFAIVFEYSVSGRFRPSTDVFFLGATGGMIFGMGAGLVAATGVISRLWGIGMPPELLVRAIADGQFGQLPVAGK